MEGEYFAASTEILWEVATMTAPAALTGHIAAQLPILSEGVYTSPRRLGNATESGPPHRQRGIFSPVALSGDAAAVFPEEEKHRLSAAFLEPPRRPAHPAGFSADMENQA